MGDVVGMTSLRTTRAFISIDAVHKPNARIYVNSLQATDTMIKNVSGDRCVADHTWAKGVAADPTPRLYDRSGGNNSAPADILVLWTLRPSPSRSPGSFQGNAPKPGLRRIYSVLIYWDLLQRICQEVPSQALSLDQPNNGISWSPFTLNTANFGGVVLQNLRMQESMGVDK
ncbi:hypothetical protein N7468_001254 [Penicillium chermesinum]|uniref:Uncharacterized protein n=1 Tax=Penicillium chermesinum TaxID=63820 RepID=A0A9W9PGA4_9EURO|nr:uncharacterized protein N7468_001254 [Penicillium chermesinum]KAJ5246271.1 hypothetical protein N7468_001254 [Penicillium chermesinum]